MLGNALSILTIHGYCSCLPKKPKLKKTEKKEIQSSIHCGILSLPVFLEGEHSWFHCHLCSRMPINLNSYLLHAETWTSSPIANPSISSQLSHLCKPQSLFQQCWEKIYVCSTGESLLPCLSLNSTSAGCIWGREFELIFPSALFSI